jgi:hypothetical protein
VRWLSTAGLWLRLACRSSPVLVSSLAVALLAHVMVWQLVVRREESLVEELESRTISLRENRSAFSQVRSCSLRFACTCADQRAREQKILQDIYAGTNTYNWPLSRFWTLLGRRIRHHRIARFLRCRHLDEGDLFIGVRGRFGRCCAIIWLVKFRHFHLSLFVRG